MKKYVAIGIVSFPNNARLSRSAVYNVQPEKPVGCFTKARFNSFYHKSVDSVIPAGKHTKPLDRSSRGLLLRIIKFRIQRTRSL